MQHYKSRHQTLTHSLCLPRPLLAATAIFGASLVCSGEAAAQCAGSTCTVGTEAEMRTAIAYANANAGTTINLTSSVTLTAGDLPALQASGLVINGNGNALSGGGSYRGLFVYSGSATVENLTIKDASATGGTGGGRGGGGAGLGGALFVATGASVTVRDVALEDNTATGGAGGSASLGGGGGGMGGSGGNYTSSYPGGGGGLGSGAHGGNDGDGSDGIVAGQAPGGTAGFAGGAGGGGGGAGASAAPAAGGGVGGAAPVGSNGGAGGFGGGGGSGGSQGAGGAGGFGGGGGGGVDAQPGGTGGYGGGGGSTSAGGTGGRGGFGGGAGRQAGGGGGGAGMGGGVFVMEGGSLTVAGDFQVSGNSVAGGAAGPSAAAGSAFGSALFLQGNGTLTFDPATGRSQTIFDNIEDEKGVIAGGYVAPASFGAGGSWGIVKNGDGTLTLSGTNTYTGGTTVNAGTLSVAADDNLGGSAGALQLNGGTLEVAGTTFASTSRSVSLGSSGGTFKISDASHAFEITQGITGSGGLSKTGGGTLVVSGANTYSGTTFIDAGTLRADAAGTFSANSAHAIAAGATLDLDGYDQTIGSLAGTGNIDLGSATLTAGSDDTSATFSGVASGSGSFTKAGTGTTTFNGTNTYSGGTTIDGGTLIVGVGGVGSIASSAVTVGDRGKLSGTGDVGGVTVQAGGIHAPGNSIGTQTVHGPYVLNTGGILQIEINDAGLSDVVVVNGTVNLTGATLSVLAEAGNYNSRTSYTILENDGADAITGKFGSVTSNLAFLTPTVSYVGGDGNDVELTMSRNDTDFTSAATTGNQWAVASALNTFAPGNPLFDAVIGQTDAGAQQAFNALSGEAHATSGAATARDNRATRGTVFSRLRQAYHAQPSGNGAGSSSVALANTGFTSVAGSASGNFDGSMMALGMGEDRVRERTDLAADFNVAPPASSNMFWTMAFGSWGSASGDANVAGADRTLGGFLSGVDTSIGGDWRAGVAVGYTQSNLSVSQRLSSSETESYHIAAYTGGSFEDFALRTGVSWSTQDIITQRAAVFPGFVEHLEADYGGSTAQVFGELAMPQNIGPFAYEPFVNLAYVHTSVDAFTETGGAAALKGAAYNQETAFSNLGIRFAAQTQIGDADVVPRLSIAWQRAFGDLNSLSALAFSSGGPGMAIRGVGLARDSALIEAGIDINISPSATLGVSYNGEIADGAEDHGVSGRLNWNF